MVRAGMLLALWLFAGCSSISVNHDWDPDTDFDAYSTWAWLSTDQPASGDVRVDSPLVDTRVRTAVEEELAERGLALTSESNAACLLSYHVVVERVSEVHFQESHRYRGAGPSSETVVYDEGTLILDILDAGTRQLVWRGTARGAVDETASPVERSERVRQAVSDLLDGFPPERLP